ncbi:MAG: DUF4168 domain-containing protein [Betaproteobacteria bacterium]
MTPSLRLITVAFCTALAASLAPITAAQTPAPSIQQPAPAYSEDELKTFAVAALEVLRINDAYLPKLKMAATPEQQQQVERTASDEMVKAVEKEGMSVAKYKEIMSHAEANPEIAQKVIKHMKEAQSAPGAGR